ncbi:hypothetical protein SVA_0798 [Sulfurifustis variabilis]|uniref:Thioredoxin-like fold domain-containing protein n=1 Tax=Sulfurifustis variabilis TaxID=1675686 RepID=A0A1B4VD53_9GAMM|nr:HEAT repeat domain-containing protein [Sulfurifustis variabilis]BAU47377.1 hypothetical protein SVA_0798 [Sulfurifustis variabilis]
MTASPRRAPDALLLLTSACPFCPTVLKGLSELVKTGEIGRLEVINLDQHPEAAARHKVRSVPWVRLGPYELDGLRSEAELKQWAERTGTPEGAAAYLSELLATGELAKVTDLVNQDSVHLDALALLLGDTETDLHVRLGIGALLEGMQGSPVLARLVEPLARLAESPEARIRGDAAHFLALTRDPRVPPILARLARDADPGVREVAAEGVATLSAARPADPGT